MNFKKISKEEIINGIDYQIMVSISNLSSSNFGFTVDDIVNDMTSRNLNCLIHHYYNNDELKEIIESKLLILENGFMLYKDDSDKYYTKGYKKESNIEIVKSEIDIIEEKIKKEMKDKDFSTLEVCLEEFYKQSISHSKTNEQFIFIKLKYKDESDVNYLLSTINKNCNEYKLSIEKHIDNNNKYCIIEGKLFNVKANPNVNILSHKIPQYRSYYLTRFLNIN